MGGGWADGKRSQWLGFLILRKTGRTAELVEGKGESERKRLCVCSFGGWSIARGLVETGSPFSFSVSFTVSSSPLSFPLSFSVSSKPLSILFMCTLPLSFSRSLSHFSIAIFLFSFFLFLSG